MKKKKRIILWVISSIVCTPLILVTIWFIGLATCGWGVIERFGNNYALIADGRNYVVITYCKDRACDVGKVIVGDKVISYNYNKRWIIAKSDNENHWIIDKTIPINLKDSINPEPEKAGLIGPLDSLEFYKDLDKYDIKLKLKDR